MSTDRNVPMDDTESMILSDGYVDNARLWRRWVMAQMFRNYRDGDGRYAFSRRFFHDRPYRYEWTTTSDEVGVLARLSGEELRMRERFFSYGVVVAMLRHYRSALTEYMKKAAWRHDPGWEERTAANEIARQAHSYVVVPNVGKVYLGGPRRSVLTAIRLTDEAINRVSSRSRCRSYRDLSSHVAWFMREALLPLPLEKSAAWKNAFTLSGAYYTMDNLIKFHGCRMYGEDGLPMSLEDSLDRLQAFTDEFSSRCDSGWRLLGVMRDLVKRNGFDFRRAMDGIYAEQD